VRVRAGALGDSVGLWGNGLEEGACVHNGYKHKDSEINGACLQIGCGRCGCGLSEDLGKAWLWPRGARARSLAVVYEWISSSSM